MLYIHINEFTISVVQEFIDSVIIGEIIGQSNQREIIINIILYKIYRFYSV